MHLLWHFSGCFCTITKVFAFAGRGSAMKTYIFSALNKYLEIVEVVLENAVATPFLLHRIQKNTVRANLTSYSSEMPFYVLMMPYIYILIRFLAHFHLALSFSFYQFSNSVILQCKLNGMKCDSSFRPKCLNELFLPCTCGFSLFRISYCSKVFCFCNILRFSESDTQGLHNCTVFARFIDFSK